MWFSLFKLINKYKTIVKFAFSGAAATVIHFLLLFVLTDVFQVWYIISTIVGYIGGFFVSFTLQKFWTFRDRSRRWRQQVFLYFLVSLTGLGANVAMMYVLVDNLRVWYLLAQLITVCFIAIGNFIVYRLIIFKKSSSIEPEAGRKKKVVLATGIFPPDIGGPATYAKIVAQELTQNGYEVAVITYAGLKGKNSSGESAGFQVVKVLRARNLFRRYFKYFLVAWRQARDADIVYLQDPVSAGLPAALACYLRGRDYILKIVGDYAWEQGRQRFGVRDGLDEFQKNKYSWRVEVFRRLEIWVAKQAQLVIVPSQYLKSIVIGWGVSADKIKVIYNAVVAPRVDISQEQAKSGLGLAADNFIVISVGRLVPWKGFSILIDLIPVLIEEIADLKLIIAGNGPERGKLEAQSEKLKVKDKILFTGQLPQEKLWQYLRAADLFVLNTGYEGLPHIIIEAMFLGLPVITTRVGGNPEVVSNGKNGILVEYNNREEIRRAILDLYYHPEIRKRLAREAAASLDKFSRREMIKQLQKEFERILFKLN
jgi:glycosyltransferase involved in cell wall biosynthesis/putative flippase GtrA